ncbi:dihydrolipoyl dehydrogenase [Bacillus sp. CGMCC 1.16607]|uniref:dihydrolipoyl dehydrogenase n=1 Tax=Bacillus sp. CGMCC 1.16607 TaxID=3351842 RepID=UPI00363D1EA5
MVVGELAHEKDIVIIGGGPGGYHAAIRAAQLGKKVTLIEKNELGGVCLNEGCIPSKILTTAAARINLFKDSEEMGIGDANPIFHYEKLRNYQRKVMDQLKNGVKALVQANKVEMVHGNAYFLSDDRIGIDSGDHFEVFKFNQAVIATGSIPEEINGIIPNGDKIFNSKMILDMTEIPGHLLIYGHNEMALEMASSFHTFGSEVTILLDKEDFGFDPSIEKEVKRILKKKKIKLIKNVQLTGVQRLNDVIQVEITTLDEKVSVSGTHLLLATNTVPNTKQLGLEKIGVILDKHGFIVTDKQCQSSLATIYAVGDVTEGPALAVKAIKQGKVAAESIAGKLAEFDPFFLPKIVHFQPQIATVGISEEYAIEQGLKVNIAQFPLASNGYATLLGKKEGFIKVISDAENETILGIHMMGEGAIELISSGILSLEMVAREEDLTFPLYPHPSINEGLLEAVESLKDMAVHIPPKKIQNKVTI